MGNWVKIPCIRWFEINLFCVFSELINLFCVFSDSGARCEPRCILQVYSPQSIHLPGHPQLHMDCQALWLWPAMCRRQVGSKWLTLTELITVVEWNIIYLLNWHNPRNYTELEVKYVVRFPCRQKDIYRALLPWWWRGSVTQILWFEIATSDRCVRLQHPSLCSQVRILVGLVHSC